jgi:curved DNA-binding protein CbpA
MTAIDPYRLLEIRPGASQAEVKAAYRRLAKLYHPDSAGERALPRFLAIQAAYEILVDEPGRVRAAPGRASNGRSAAAPPPAWQADASRARATREAYRARSRRGTTSSGASGTSGASAGASGPSAGPSPRARTRTGPVGGDAGAGSGTGGGGGAGRTKRSSRRTKATIGSTSYDGADHEPFDPAWEGATWYGAGSGTYWTINPKEYADPRKHGPEYLARSLRATETVVDEPLATGSVPASGPPGPQPEAAAAPASTSAFGTLRGWFRRVR